jgi:two-component system sporulation sensor kinase A
VRAQLEPMVFSSIVQTLRDAVVVINCTGKVLLWNKAAEALFADTGAERIGQWLASLIPAQDCGAFEEELSQPVESGIAQAIGEPVEACTYTHEDQECPLEVTITPLRTECETVFVAVLRDISKVKRLEDQMARLKSQFELILAAAKDGIFGFDQEGRATFINPAGAAMLGYTQDEFIGQPQHQLIHHTRLDGAPYAVEDCPIHSALHDGSSRFVEDDVFWKKDGSSIPVQYVSTPIVDKGKIDGAVVYFRDITERKEQERRLYESEQRYQCLLKYNPDGVCALDLAGRYTDVNEAYERLVGYSRAELLGRDFREVNIFPEDVSLADQLFQEALNGKSLENVEFTVRRKDGTRVEVSLTSAPILVRGELLGLYVIIKDVTEQKRSRQKLMQSEERYRRLVESSLDAIGIHDGETWLFMNGPGLQMFGAASEADVIGKPVCGFLDPDQSAAFRQHIRTIMADKQVVGRTEMKWRTVDGRPIHSETIGIPIDYENRVAVQVIIRDITERKRSEELLLKSEKLSAVGQLAAGVAHEIRNPLTALKGFTQLLTDYCAGSTKRYLDIMQTELERIDVILNELLILAKPQAVKFHPQPIGAVLQEVITLLSTQAILQNVIIESSVDPHGPVVNCERNQMKQVFVNIIKNAIEAMPGGGRLSISARTEDDKVCIQFVDEGEGIPAELVSRLGEPFFTTKEKGTGLGLLVSHRIVLAHQGTIDITSEVGKGTTVSVVLPILKQGGLPDGVG